jgi:hypothetical protein
MTLPRNWVLKTVEEFPATRLVLETIAEHHGARNGKVVVNKLIDAGKLVMIGDKRGARYALPGTKPRRKRA